MHKGKIFCLGLSRTGTTSLHVAAVLAGFSSIHYPLCYNNLAIHWLKGDFSRSRIRDFQCFSDLPTPAFYREFDRTHSGAKFILTRRDEARWIESVQQIYAVQMAPSPKTPWRNCVSAACYGLVEFNRQRFLDVYRRHNADVMNYFKDKPGKLLVLDLENEEAPWVPLCRFLNVSAPDLAFPKIRVPDLGSLSWVKADEIPVKTEKLKKLVRLS
ncbi:MAG: sulfotransferase family protein [Dongiaceae bacterium]